MQAKPPVVLIVDDEASTRELVRELLEPEGYAVVEAGDGLAGAARIDQGSIDCVLLDVMLPDIDGLELCRQIRASETDEHLPIIMLTALGSDLQRHAGFAVGADDYVAKPFQLAELVDRVRVWTRTRLREQVRAATQPGLLPVEPPAAPAGQPTEPAATAATGQPTVPAAAGATAGAYTPRGWCRRLLTLLGQQQAHAPDMAYLQMLLTSCIQLDPTPEAFDAWLAQHVASARPGIADAAAVLRRAWQREEGAPAIAPLSEQLRTLGGLLDEVGARVAAFAVAGGQAQVRTYQEAPAQTLEPRQLRRESSLRAALRGSGPRVAPAGPRYEPLLRVLGEVLEADPVQTYEVLVTPRAIVVDGDTSGCQVFTLDQLDLLLRAATQERDTPPPA
ncbi:MAG TPA: response regulator [Chloroflexota bacterium]|jgi:CheY-like chemotaxis protein